MKYYLIVFLLILGGCASNSNTRVSNTPSVVLKNTHIELQLREEIIFVADNQFHNIYTDPTLLASIIADKYKHVAIRPPQLNLFSPDLFIYSLKENAKDARIIHLGDALNISSSYEWDVFRQCISDRSIGHNGWVMVPGNHDVYFYGNGAGEHHEGDKRGGLLKWTDAANTTGVQIEHNPNIFAKPFTKELFIEEYIKEISSQRKKGFPEKGAFINALYLADGRLKDCFEWESPDSDAFITRLAGKYFDNDEDYWKSFLVQELSIKTKNEADKIYMILIDTTNYIARPSLTSWLREKLRWSKKVNSGTKGEVSGDQQRIINRWIDDNGQKGTQYILAGHHPFKDLTNNSKEWLKQKSKDDRFITYISAHTHDPIKAYKSCQDNSMDIKEVNIGSITDTPRTTPEECGELFAASPQYTILRKNGKIETKDDFALKIAKNALREKFELRNSKYYLRYKDKASRWDTKKAPHRANIKLIAEAYLDMFETLQPELSDEVKSIQKKLQEVSQNNKIIKAEVFDYVNILKEAKKIDDDLRRNNKYKKHRLLYGAWEAVQASLAEAGYCFIGKSEAAIEIKKAK